MRKNALFVLGILFLSQGCDAEPGSSVPDCPEGTWRVCVTEDRQWGRRWCGPEGWEPVCLPPECVPGDEEECPTACDSPGRRWCDEDGWWLPCLGEEVCDGGDNDCDGDTDEGLEEVCHCGFRWGVRRCVGGTWLPCDTGHDGLPESCNALDDDCDGMTDEGLLRPCATICEEGLETCEVGAWVDCTARPPTEEVCNNIDDDCDGLTDEDQPQQDCGVGECRRLLDTCEAGVPVWCDPWEGAVKEVCDGLDNDCDGDTDEGAPGCCDPGESRACSTTAGVCSTGISECREDGTWGTCSGALPAPETCDGLDNDCDGDTDEGEPGINQVCGSDFALCKSGMTACVNGGLSCLGDIPGSPEGCDGKDNDCDGDVDEGIPGVEDEEEPNETCQNATLVAVPVTDDNALIMYEHTLYREGGGVDVDWFELVPYTATEDPDALMGITWLITTVALDAPQGVDMQLCYSTTGCKQTTELSCPAYNIVSKEFHTAYVSMIHPRIHVRISGPGSCKPYLLSVRYVPLFGAFDFYTSPDLPNPFPGPKPW